MDELQQLEFLNLVGKITQEIETYAGVNDKSLAQFVISLHDESNGNLQTFKSKLAEVGADFPESFVDNVDRLILSIHPKYKKKKTKQAENGSTQDASTQQDITEGEKQRRLFPGLALQNKTVPDPVSDDVFLKEIGDLVSGKKSRPRPSVDEPAPKRPRLDDSPPRHGRSRSRSPPPPRGRSDFRDSRDRPGPPGRMRLDDKPVLYKIYNGRVTGLKDFGVFVSLEGIAGRAEGANSHIFRVIKLSQHSSQGMVHVSNIQSGARISTPADLLTRNQPVKVKVVSAAGTRIGLSMKDVDQTTGQDLTPHLRIRSEAEMEAERTQAARGANAIPLGSSESEAPPPPPSSGAVRSAKRLTSPERWELKQLIASGALDASEYPELDEEFHNPMAHAEVEEELDVEVREEEPPFLAGQTKKTLDLSPVKIVKAPDGSLNRAAMAGASLAKERREIRQQEANEAADSQKTDLNEGWLDPMAKEADRGFAQDLRGNTKAQNPADSSQWRSSSFNKATSFGEITSLSIQDQRKSLPIYKLRDPLLQAIDEVRLSPL